MELSSIFLIISIIFFFIGIGMIAALIIKGDHDDTGIPLQDGWDNPFFSRFPARKK